MERMYPGIVERTADGWSILLPDFGAVAGAGDTVEEAYASAQEAGALFVDATVRAGGSIPEPSALDAIERDPDVVEAGRVLVPVSVPGRAIRLNITMDEGLVAQIDRVAKNRSAFLAEAARAALRGRAA